MTTELDDHRVRARRGVEPHAVVLAHLARADRVHRHNGEVIDTEHLAEPLAADLVGTPDQQAPVAGAHCHFSAFVSPDI
jgi:hypothetical protein